MKYGTSYIRIYLQKERISIPIAHTKKSALQNWLYDVFLAKIVQVNSSPLLTLTFLQLIRQSTDHKKI